MRPWRVLLVPPTPGAPTRAFDVARWQARLALGFAVMLVLIAAAALSATVAAVRSPDLFARGAEVRALREQLAAAEDSLSLARLALAEGDETAVDSNAARSTPPNAIASEPHVAKRPASLVDRLAVKGIRVASPGGGSASTALSRIAELPVIGAIVSGFSGARKHPLLHITRPHLGIDVSAPSGTPVSAPASGHVTFVGRRFSYGLTVEVEHANGVLTRYAHLRSADVTEGEALVRGGLIGKVGSSGLTTGPHLHYEVIVNGRPVDPLRFRLPQVGDSAVAGLRARTLAPGAGSPVGTHDDAAAVPVITPMPPALP